MLKLYIEGFYFSALVLKFPAIRISALKNTLPITEIHSEKTGVPKKLPVFLEITQNSYRKRVIFMPKCAILINSEQSRAEQSRAEQSRAEQSRLMLKFRQKKIHISQREIYCPSLSSRYSSYIFVHRESHSSVFSGGVLAS